MNLQYNGEGANIYVVKETSGCGGGNEEGERDGVGSLLDLNKKGPTTNGLMKWQFS